jgi:hypothetical protein
MYVYMLFCFRSEQKVIVRHGDNLYVKTLPLLIVLMIIYGIKAICLRADKLLKQSVNSIFLRTPVTELRLAIHTQILCNKSALYHHFPTLIPLGGVGTTCFSSCCSKDFVIMPPA